MRTEATAPKGAKEARPTEPGEAKEADPGGSPAAAEGAPKLWPPPKSREEMLAAISEGFKKDVAKLHSTPKRFEEDEGLVIDYEHDDPIGPGPGYESDDETESEPKTTAETPDTEDER